MTQTADTPVEQAGPSRSGGGNAVGIASFVTGALALAPVALVLGIVGLARYRSGKASRRSWPLAGTILGAVGLVAGAALAVAWTTSDGPALTQDAHARVDAVNVGNAFVDWYAANPAAEDPYVEIAADGYVVGDTRIPSALDPDRGDPASFAVSYADAADWCLTFTYAGGTVGSVGYSSTEGLVDSCPAG